MTEVPEKLYTLSEVDAKLVKDLVNAILEARNRLIVLNDSIAAAEAKKVLFEALETFKQWK
jgi:hypothetical protein